MNTGRFFVVNDKIQYIIFTKTNVFYIKNFTILKLALVIFSASGWQKRKSSSGRTRCVCVTSSAQTFAHFPIFHNNKTSSVVAWAFAHCWIKSFKIFIKSFLHVSSFLAGQSVWNWRKLKKNCYFEGNYWSACYCLCHRCSNICRRKSKWIIFQRLHCLQIQQWSERCREPKITKPGKRLNKQWDEFTITELKLKNLTNVYPNTYL